MTEKPELHQSPDQLDNKLSNSAVFQLIYWNKFFFICIFFSGLFQEAAWKSVMGVFQILKHILKWNLTMVSPTRRG